MLWRAELHLNTKELVWVVGTNIFAIGLDVALAKCQ